jgi:hypothetical protein
MSDNIAVPRELESCFTKADRRSVHCIRAPRLVRIHNGSHVRMSNTVIGAVGLFLNRTGPPWPDGLERRLQSGEFERSDAISLLRSYPNVSGNDAKRQPSAADKLDLVYDGHILLSVSYSWLRMHGGCWLPFSGGMLTDEKFSIHEYATGTDLAEWQPIVMVQYPEISKLEAALNARVPGNMEEIHTDTKARVATSGISAPLLAMDGGWAIGGNLARRVIVQLRKRFAEEAAGQ